MTDFPSLYYETGQGPSVVFSHGTLMDWTMFEPQIDALKARYHVVAFNHRARTENYQPGYKLPTSSRIVGAYSMIAISTVVCWPACRWAASCQSSLRCVTRSGYAV